MKKKYINGRIKYKQKYKKEQDSDDNTSKFKINFIFKAVLIFIFIFSNKYSYSNDITPPPPPTLEEKKALQEILSFENNINLTDETFYEFRFINRRNELIDENIKFEKSEKPDISVIMMVYNQAYCLHKCMRSIQNQSLKNIEIIVVDDCSLDNSVELIKEYQKEDPRIILIEHDANRGMIKTRSDGMRMAKGLYVTTVDGDDAFIHKDILKNSLYIAQKGNIDVIEFPKRFFSGQKFYETIYHFPNLNLNSSTRIKN